MNRWFRLAAAVVAMIMIGNLQYAWTLFVQPMMTATGWKLSEVQWGFTFFVAVMTWSMPLAGWMIDRIGPRLFMTLAGVLCAVGWCGLGYARSLPEFYALYSIAGLGNCFVYACSTALGLKWFPDKRGVASGLIAAGYGSGAAFFNPGFGLLIGGIGHQATFLYTGLGLGLVVLTAGQFLEYPPDGHVPVPANLKTPVRRQTEQFNSIEMLRTPQFYVLYAMMLAIGIGGLMATAQVAPVARNFGVGAGALSVAMFLNPLCNGVARIGWGVVSDKLGREKTMALAFGLQAAFLASVVTIGRGGDTLFVVTMALVFLTWGELYVLFPTVSADFFGGKNAASNYSFLYSTKGVASILAGGLAAKLFEATGTWNYAFLGSAGLALASSIAALGLLKMPLPKKRATEAPATAMAGSPAQR
jgi:OFA family oxalate/formate antiporter-like MFS transporter